jgi:hypothetical protein
VKSKINSGFSFASVMSTLIGNLSAPERVYYLQPENMKKCALPQIP